MSGLSSLSGAPGFKKSAAFGTSESKTDNLSSLSGAPALSKAASYVTRTTYDDDDDDFPTSKSSSKSRKSVLRKSTPELVTRQTADDDDLPKARGFVKSRGKGVSFAGKQDDDTDSDSKPSKFGGKSLRSSSNYDGQNSEEDEFGLSKLAPASKEPPKPVSSTSYASTKGSSYNFLDSFLKDDVPKIDSLPIKIDESFDLLGPNTTRTSQAAPKTGRRAAATSQSLSSGLDDQIRTSQQSQSPPKSSFGLDEPTKRPGMGFNEPPASTQAPPLFGETRRSPITQQSDNLFGDPDPPILGSGRRGGMDPPKVHMPTPAQDAYVPSSRQVPTNNSSLELPGMDLPPPKPAQSQGMGMSGPRGGVMEPAKVYMPPQDTYTPSVPAKKVNTSLDIDLPGMDLPAADSGSSAAPYGQAERGGFGGGAAGRRSLAQKQEEEDLDLPGLEGSKSHQNPYSAPQPQSSGYTPSGFGASARAAEISQPKTRYEEAAPEDKDDVFAGSGYLSSVRDRQGTTTRRSTPALPEGRRETSPPLPSPLGGGRPRAGAFSPEISPGRGAMLAAATKKPEPAKPVADDPMDRANRMLQETEQRRLRKDSGKGLDAPSAGLQPTTSQGLSKKDRVRMDSSSSDEGPQPIKSQSPTRLPRNVQGGGASGGGGLPPGVERFGPVSASTPPAPVSGQPPPGVTSYIPAASAPASPAPEPAYPVPQSMGVAPIPQYPPPQQMQAPHLGSPQMLPPQPQAYPQAYPQAQGYMPNQQMVQVAPALVMQPPQAMALPGLAPVQVPDMQTGLMQALLSVLGQVGTAGAKGAASPQKASAEDTPESPKTPEPDPAIPLLEKEIEELKLQIVKLKGELEVSQANLTASKTESQRNADEAGAARLQVMELETLGRSKDARVRELEAALSAAHAQASMDLAEAGASAAREASGLRSEIEELRASATRSRKHYETLHDELRTEINRLRTEAATAAAEAAAELARVKDGAAAVAAEAEARGRRVGLVEKEISEAHIKMMMQALTEEKETVTRQRLSGEMLQYLSEKVSKTANSAMDREDRAVHAMERDLADREARAAAREQLLSDRESRLAGKERELDKLRADLQILVTTLESNSIQDRQELQRDHSRLSKESARMDALTNALIGDKEDLKLQVALERRLLEEARDTRRREREDFVTEISLERRSLATEYANTQRTLDASRREVLTLKSRCVEMEERIAVNAKALHEQEAQLAGLKAAADAERIALEHERMSLEREKSAFNAEIAQLIDLGQRVQRESAELSGYHTELRARQHDIDAAKQALEARLSALHADTTQLHDQQKALAERKKAIEQEWQQIADKRKKCAEESAAASKAADAARAAQLKLADAVRNYVRQGVPIPFAVQTSPQDKGVNLVDQELGANHPASRASSPGRGPSQRVRARSSNPSRGRNRLRRELEKLGLDPTLDVNPVPGGTGGNTDVTGGVGADYVRRQREFLYQISGYTPEASAGGATTENHSNVYAPRPPYNSPHVAWDVPNTPVLSSGPPLAPHNIPHPTMGNTPHPGPMYPSDSRNIGQVATGGMYMPSQPGTSVTGLSASFTAMLPLSSNTSGRSAGHTQGHSMGDEGSVTPAGQRAGSTPGEGGVASGSDGHFTSGLSESNHSPVALGGLSPETAVGSSSPGTNSG